MITKNKKYQSFEEIETDLKILKLKKQIDGLYLKNNVSDLKDNLSVKNVVSNTFSNIGFSFLNSKTRWINLIVDYAIYFLLRRKR
ncbi:DUF6327 family protein [Capnocytophaga cynodegmi]|uniref:DUF6327 family protein n=1 Tax=Capnocytophaga cynodegmi TaxID=28189 RepID=UPI0038583D95